MCFRGAMLQKWLGEKQPVYLKRRSNKRLYAGAAARGATAAALVAVFAAIGVAVAAAVIQLLLLKLQLLLLLLLLFVMQEQRADICRLAAAASKAETARDEAASHVASRKLQTLKCRL